MKTTVNYNRDSQEVAFGDALDLAELDEGRLKITHHRSGFVQYSGDGVVSGLDEDGNPRGVGVFSRPLDDVGTGPVFGAGVQGITELEETNKCSKHDLLVSVDEIPKWPGGNGVMLEIHYFKPAVRRFVYKDAQGRNRIDIPHPSGFIVPMYAIYAPDGCEYPGVLGIELYGQRFSFGDSGFSLSGPGEKERYNESGDRLADVIGCIFPRPANTDGAKSLDYNAVG